MGSQLRSFLQKRPILCLVLIAPLVEYLTGSSQLSWLIENPILFFVFLAQNFGSYGAAVLLIREAKVRWQKGWGSVLLLGAAYGIVNEGIGADTLFYPHTPGVAGIGLYGQWLGVNWVNVAVLIPIVHPLFSVAFPLLLLDLALPETRGKSLLGTGGISITFVILGIDAIITSIFVTDVINHFYAGPVLLGGCLVAIAALSGAAWYAPRNILGARRSLPSTTPVRLAIVGAVFPWVIFATGGVLARVGTPAVILIPALFAEAGWVLAWILRNIGRSQNEILKVALATGLIAGLIPMGLLSQLETGVGLVPVVGGDLLAVFFLSHLWRKYRAPSGFPSTRGGTPPRTVSRPVSG